MKLEDYLPALKYGVYPETGLPFSVSLITTPADTSPIGGSSMVILPDTAVTNGKKVYLSGFTAFVDTTAWTAGGNAAAIATLAIQDTSGTSFISWGTTVMAADAVIFAQGAVTATGTVGLGMTYSDAFQKGSGGTPGRGLRLTGSGTCSVGGTVTVTCFGVIK